MMDVFSAGPGTSIAAEMTTTGLPVAMLSHRPNSHPFTERRLILNLPSKIGRAVAKTKPAEDNAIFDCKVLSRNHAMLWYENGKFWVQDTRSSNGTFVNSQRLSSANEESPPKEVFSNDVVQFGVDVIENSRRVTHGCIMASVRLFHADGSEALRDANDGYGCGQLDVSGASGQGGLAQISQLNLYQLSQYLKEAMEREEALCAKLTTLQSVLGLAQQRAAESWHSLVEEDRMLSRIESLQTKLESLINLTNNLNEEHLVTSLRHEVMKMYEERETYELLAKESLRRATEQTLLAHFQVNELQVSFTSSQEERKRYQESTEAHEKLIEELHITIDDQKSAHREAMENLKQEHQRELEEQLQEKNDKIQQIEGLIADIEQLTADNDRLLKKIEKSEEELKANDEALRKEISQLMSENASLLVEVNKLKNLPVENGQDKTNHVNEDDGGHNVESSVESSELLEEEAQEELRNHLKELTADLATKQCENEELIAKCDRLAGFESQLTKVTALFNEANQLAEKRKQFIDQMKMTLEEQISSHRQSIDNLKSQHQTEIDELTKERNDKISHFESLITELRNENAALKKGTNEMNILRENQANKDEEITAKNQLIFELEERLKSSVKEIEKLHINSENDKEKLILSKSEPEVEVNGFKKQLDERDEKLARLEEELSTLKAEIKDSREKHKIQESKLTTTVNDVRQQAQQEKQRADKLQERLNQLQIAKPANGSKLTLNDSNAMNAMGSSPRPHANQLSNNRDMNSILDISAVDSISKLVSLTNENETEFSSISLNLSPADVIFSLIKAAIGCYFLYSLLYEE